VPDQGSPFLAFARPVAKDVAQIVDAVLDDGIRLSRDDLIGPCPVFEALQRAGVTFERGPTDMSVADLAKRFGARP